MAKRICPPKRRAVGEKTRGRPGATVGVDLVTNITNNHASDSDDVFGVLCFI